MRRPRTKPRLRDLLRATCEMFEVPKEAIHSTNKLHLIAVARATFICAAIGVGYDGPKIGAFLDRDERMVSRIVGDIRRGRVTYVTTVQQSVPRIIDTARGYFEAWMRLCQRPAGDVLRERIEAERMPIVLPRVRRVLQRREPIVVADIKTAGLKLDEGESLNVDWWRINDARFRAAMVSAAEDV